MSFSRLLTCVLALSHKNSVGVDGGELLPDITLITKLVLVEPLHSMLMQGA